MSILFYRRPDYIAKVPGPMNLTQCQIYVERTQKHKRAIPPELSFEKVIQNRALPPCSLQDFMDYLVYVSHDAENLQFWLWLQDYTKRFYAAPRSEQALSPPWYQVEAAQPVGIDPNSTDPPRTSEKKRPKVSEFEINFDNTNTNGSSELPPLSPLMSPQFDKQSFISGVTGSTHRSAAESVEDANAQVGLKWQSFTVQPFRAEIARVISHYLAPSSPRELNLSHRHRAAVLHALQHTTHPSSFDLVKDMVEGTLRGQSHPNFIRWSICNGNRPRVLFVKWNGYLHFLAGIILAVLLICSSKARWWRLFAFPLLFIGVDICVAAWKGVCVIIHTSHCRALRPWEQFSEDSASSLSGFESDDDIVGTLSKAGGGGAGAMTPGSYSIGGGGYNIDIEMKAGATPTRSTSGNMSTGKRGGISMDTFGTANSYGHERWVERYRMLPLIKKVFAKQIWIQDETIRLLQDRIVMQSHVWALGVCVPLMVLLVALPRFAVL